MQLRCLIVIVWYGVRTTSYVKSTTVCNSVLLNARTLSDINYSTDLPLDMRNEVVEEVKLKGCQL